MQTNPAEQSKIIRWFESLWNQSGRKGKGLRRKEFAEEVFVSVSVSVYVCVLISLCVFLCICVLDIL